MHLLMWKIDKKILRGAKNDEFDYLGTKVKCVKKNHAHDFQQDFLFLSEVLKKFEKIYLQLSVTEGTCNTDRL